MAIPSIDSVISVNLPVSDHTLHCISKGNTDDDAGGDGDSSDSMLYPSLSKMYMDITDGDDSDEAATAVLVTTFIGLTLAR